LLDDEHIIVPTQLKQGVDWIKMRAISGNSDGAIPIKSGLRATEKQG
jgi:hypothetical protein